MIISVGLYGSYLKLSNFSFLTKKKQFKIKLFNLDWTAAVFLTKVRGCTHSDSGQSRFKIYVYYN
jgi:hypothetical protein